MSDRGRQSAPFTLSGTFACLFLVSGVLLRAQEVVPLRAATTEVLSAPGGDHRSLHIDIPPGKVLAVTFEQVQGTVQVKWVPEGAKMETCLPRSNRSGKLSAITFHALGAALETTGGGEKSEANRGELIVENHTRAVSTFRLIAGALRDETSNDRKMSLAEEDEMQATQPASMRTPATLQERMRLLKQAEGLWRETGQESDLALTLSLESFTEAFPLNDGAAALRHLPELVDLAGKIVTTSPVQAADAHKTAAFVYAQQAMYAQALEQYNAALPLFQGTGDTYNQVTILENRAKIERIEGHTREALADVEAALPLAQGDQDHVGELALEVERGAIASAAGKLGTAYQADLRAVALSETTVDPYLNGLAWSDLGVAYTELRDFAEADRALDHADAIWKKSSNLYGQIQTTEDRAELRLAQGDLAGARAAFTTGTEATRAMPREHSYFLRGLAVSEMRAGELQRADETLGQARAEAEKAQVNDTLSQIQSIFGDLKARQGQWEEAAGHWGRAEAIAREQHNSLNRAVALGGLVRAATHGGDLAQASQTCRDAMDELESVRGEIPDTDLRFSFFSSRHELYDLCVSVDLRSGDQESAFNTAERGRARALLDQAAAAGLETGLPDNLLQRIRENGKRLAAARQQVGRDSGAVVELLKTRAALREEAAGSGIAGRLQAATVTATQRELIRSLDEHTALLDYWEGKEQSCVWMITAHGAAVYRLPPAMQLDAQVQRYLHALLAPLQPSESTSAVARSHFLKEAKIAAALQGAALLKVLLPMRLPPSISRLVVVKDGGLLPLSPATLPIAEGQYLSSRFELVAEPSASFLLRVPAKSEPLARWRVIVFADPTASPGGVRTVLPFARQEEQSVRTTFGTAQTQVLEGAAASRDAALTMDWSRYQAAHFATHAVLSKAHPELSGLLLSAGDRAASTAGLLSYFDVLKMHAPLQLVVLSACSSGEGRFVPGEGKLALDNAFLAAGASRVVATLWPVDDEATSVFMGMFYRALAKNHSPARALREAQKEMAAGKTWSAPYDWGAFTLSGQWTSFSD